MIDRLSRSGVLLGTSGLKSMLELQARTNSFIREIAARLTLQRENDELLHILAAIDHQQPAVPQMAVDGPSVAPSTN